MQSIRQSLLQEAADGQLDLVGLTVEQYHEFIDSGVISEDTSTELLDGLVVRKDRSAAGEDPMTIGDRHRMAVMRLERLIPKFEAIGLSFLQCQQPVVLPPKHEPEPDISIIRGKLDDFVDAKPRAGDVILVLEVADNSLARDLGPKLRIYARAKIPIYIVFNLVDDVVLLHSKPLGTRYAVVETLTRQDTLKLAAGRGNYVSIPVAKLV